MKCDNVLFISDLHAPFHHPKALDFLKDLKNKLKPEMVISVGDLVDLHAISQYDPHPDAPSPGQEFELAQQALDELEALFPKMWIARGNHEDRLLKKAQRAGLPSCAQRTLSEIFNKPQWHWGDEWWIESALGQVCVTHGSRRKGALNYARLLGASVVQGHHHSDFALAFQNSRNRAFFGMDIGCLADANSLALQYASRAALGQMLGCGALVGGWPLLLPMETS